MKSQAVGYVAASGFLYGFLGLLGSELLQECSIANMLFWRFLIAGIWMLFLYKKPLLLVGKMEKVPVSSFFLLFLLGAIGYAGSAGFYFVATHYAGTGSAMVIFFSYPIVIMVANGIWQKKKPSASLVITLYIMVLGLFLLVDTTKANVNLQGICFAVLAALCYAFYVMGSKYIASLQIDTKLATLWVCFGCCSLFFLLSLWDASLYFPHSAKTLSYLVVLGVLITALPIQLMQKGLQHVSSLHASMLSLTEPLVTLFLGIVFLKENFSFLQVIGVTLLLSSAIFTQLQEKCKD